MSNVKEYLQLQYPYLRRMKTAAAQLAEETENSSKSLLLIYTRFILAVLPDILGLISIYQDFITGQQEKIEVTGFWGADFEVVPRNDFLMLPEHEPRTTPFGEN